MSNKCGMHRVEKGMTLKPVNPSVVNSTGEVLVCQERGRGRE